MLAPSTTIVEAALRAMARPAADRFVPLVCTDGRGRVLGTVTLTDLVVALAGSSAGGGTTMEGG